MESDVYARREDPIYPAIGIRDNGEITKQIAYIGDLQPTWLVVLGLIGYDEP